MEKKLLKIPKGWTIEKLDIGEEEINVYIRPYKKKLAVCSGCGAVHKEGYHSSSVIKARDLPAAGRIVYVHVTKRKYRCPVDGEIHVEHVSWLKKTKDIPLDFLKKFIV